MFTPLHSSTNQELFEKYKVATMWKIQWCHAPQLSSETEVSIALLQRLSQKILKDKAGNSAHKMITLLG